MLNGKFRTYLEEAIGRDNALVAFSALDTPASVSVRLNPYKTCPGTEQLRTQSAGVPWSRHGFVLDSRPVFTLDPLFHAGAYYVQDSSSMFVGHVFRKCLGSVRPSGPLRVLDLCAAPGGKTTDLAASLREVRGDDFLLVANEVMKQRAGVLAENVALWGDPNVVVTSDDPKAFSSLEGFFDIVLADVPCSGEGMFRKDEQAVEQWSEDNVALCAARQKRIIADMWNSLAEGGILIYSTCTFNRYENDLNAAWIASELGAEPLTKDSEPFGHGVLKTEYGYSLVPGHVCGEGQYCAAFRKKASVSGASISGGASRPSRVPVSKAESQLLQQYFPNRFSFRKKAETFIAIPYAADSCLSILESCLHVVAAGCAIGIRKGNDLIPDADMALSFKASRQVFPEVPVDRQTALRFLHRDAIVLPDAPRGFVTIVYDSLPLGYVKNLGNRCNSLHPQGRRIRMNII